MRRIEMRETQIKTGIQQETDENDYRLFPLILN